MAPLRAWLRFADIRRYSGLVNTYDLAEAAKRSGVGVDELGRLVDLPVELKGVTGAMRLHVASRPG